MICLKLTGNLLYPHVTPILVCRSTQDQSDQKMKIEESDVLQGLPFWHLAGSYLFVSGCLVIVTRSQISPAAVTLHNEN